MDDIKKPKHNMESLRRVSVMYIDEKGDKCFFEDEHRLIFEDLKSFYTDYLRCEDKPLLNSTHTTADNFASSLMHLIKGSPILNEKSEVIGLEEDIAKLAEKLLNKLKARPSRYWKDHSLFNRNTNQRIVDPLLQVAAIVEGSQERIEKLKESGVKRWELFREIRTIWESGGYPELNGKPLNATILATIVLYLTGQVYRNSDISEQYDNNIGKWNPRKTGIDIAKCDSTEYKDASKFLKKQ